ncbi:MAG: HEAT repeat domain-containing protein [bacterium]|nr:HEAT repeat domain-containing protein [bacterium]
MLKQKDFLKFFSVLVVIISSISNAFCSTEDSIKVEQFFNRLDSIYIQYGDSSMEYGIISDTIITRKNFMEIDSLFRSNLLDTTQIVNTTLNKQRPWVTRIMGINILNTASLNVLLQIGQQILSDTTENIELRKEAIYCIASSDTSETSRNILFNASQNPDLWFESMDILAQMRDNRVLTLMTDSLQSSNFINKIRAITVLGSLSDPSVYQSLAPLYNPLDSIRQQSSSPDTITQLIALQGRIITSLGGIRNQSALNFLTDKAQNGEYYFSINAIEALGELGNTNAVPVLIQIMTQPLKINPFKRLACAQALVKIGNNSPEVLGEIETAIHLATVECVEEGMVGTYIEDKMKEAFDELRNK